MPAGVWNAPYRSNCPDSSQAGSSREAVGRQPSAGNVGSTPAALEPTCDIGKSRPLRAAIPPLRRQFAANLTTQNHARQRWERRIEQALRGDRLAQFQFEPARLVGETATVDALLLRLRQCGAGGVQIASGKGGLGPPQRFAFGIQIVRARRCLRL